MAHWQASDNSSAIPLACEEIDAVETVADRAECFYNFRIHGENRGYSYLLLKRDRLFNLTRFRLDDGAVFANVFRLTLDRRPCARLPPR